MNNTQANEASVRTLEAVLEKQQKEMQILQKAVVIAVVSSMTTIASVALAVAFYFYSPEPRYFLVDENGAIVQASAISSPMEDTVRLKNWFQTAITQSFTVDHVNYKKQVSEVKKYYTPNGYSSFLDVFKGTILDTVIKHKNFTSVGIKRAPTILKESDQGGTYTYVMSMDIVLTFWVGDKSTAYDYNIKAMVRRQSTQENVYGVAISQISATLAPKG